MVNFAYPVGDTGPERPAPVTKLPSGNWEANTTIPNLPPIKTLREDTANLEALQNVNDKERIWVVVGGSEKLHLTYYLIDSGRWETVEYDAKYSDDNLFSPQLFLGRDNSIWMAENPTNYQGVSADIKLLSVYDEASQKFNSVLTLKDLPTFDPNKPIDGIDITHLQMDSQGDLWFFLRVNEPNKEAEYQLFKFSPSRHNLERHLADFNLAYESAGTLVVSPEDVLYLLDTRKANLVRYDPTKGNVYEAKIPGGELFLPSRSSLFWGSDQRLWINDNAWLDLFPGGYWNRIIQPPDFIFVQPGSGLWARTQPVYSIETDDGRLWYSAQYRGTGWVDPSTGKWCLFTSYPSNIVKDSKGYLWMIASGKLYRSRFKP
jgi:sugar lactone lactonase YvrE